MYLFHYIPLERSVCSLQLTVQNHGLTVTVLDIQLDDILN